MTVVINGTSGITDVNGTAAAPAITGTDTDTGVFFGTNTVSLSTGGTERLQIDSSGNAGLGVTPSAWSSATALQSVGGVAVSGRSANGATFSQNYYFGGSDKYIANGYASAYNQVNGVHTWSVAANNVSGAGAALSFSTALVLDSSSNLGIATTPVAIGSGNGLQAGASSIFATVASNQTYASNNAYYNGSVWKAVRAQGGYGAMRFNAVDTGSISWHNNSASYAAGDTLTAMDTTDVRMTLLANGNLLVGTTSTTQSHKMVGLVANAWALQVISSFATGSQNYGINAAFSASAPNNSSNYFFQGNDTNVNRFIVYSNGGIANYSANNTNLSDSREKTNVNPASNYLAKICAIPVRTYNYIDQNLEEDAGLTLGVFAQDVQEVAPELVMESNWGTQEEPKMRLSIYQTDLQYALMKCIQEQQAIIEQLQADVAALKAKA